jgi:hypothetical protein
MRVHACATAIAALLCSSTLTFAQAPDAASDASAGRILFTRSTTTLYNGVLVVGGTALYTIDKDGSHLSQLTTVQQGNFDYPGAESYTQTWLSKNFGPHGHRMLVFFGQSSIPQHDIPFTLSGKYFVVNDQGQQAVQLFPSFYSNDLAPPGFGFLTWGPPSTNLIAYTNAAGQNTTSPSCIYLMNSDGSNPHALWCSPNYADPPQAVESLRWSGDGKSLLAYVGYQLPVWPEATGYADLYEINVATGTGTLVAKQVTNSWYGGGATADISYDGSEVVYQQFSPDCSNADAGGDPNYSLCAQNTTTGQTTLLQANTSTGGQLLLSPDGSEVVISQYSTLSPFPEQDLYLVNTTTAALQQITRPPTNPPSGAYANWNGVAWSSDGSQLLANRNYWSSSKVVIPSTDIYVVNVAKAVARHITSGTAYDWYQPNW